MFIYKFYNGNCMKNGQERGRDWRQGYPIGGHF